MCEKQKARHTLRIEFIYDATGAKLRKTVFENNAAIETRDYINGKEYKGGALERIAHTEGAVVRNENTVFEHQYVIKDHLGNARITYRDGINKVDNTGNTTLNDGTIVASDMMQINHYYPFGMNMEGNWNGLNGKNKYQYNEKELNSDFGLDLSDYGARFYDAAIGRWNAIDPLGEMYGNMSPYQYVMNSPINFIDPTGMASEAANPGMMRNDDRTHSERFQDQNDRVLKGYAQSDVAYSSGPFQESAYVFEYGGKEVQATLVFNLLSGDESSNLLIPSFSNLWSNYPSEAEHIDPKTKKDIYGNHCAINVSHTLIKSGIKMGNFRGAKCSNKCPLGNLGKHAIRASELAEWLTSNLFEGQVLTGETFQEAIKGKTGIVYFENYWQRDGEKGKTRTGDHIDLWSKVMLKSSGVFGSWYRTNFPRLSEYFDMSDLRRSTKAIFWEIK
jgi:RHS repeat-associated protein